MAFVTLTFDPNDPKDLTNMKLCLNARQYQSAIEDFAEYLRTKLTYHGLSSDEVKAYQDMKNRLHQIIGSKSLDLWQE